MDLFIALAPWLLASQLLAVPVAGMTGWIARATGSKGPAAAVTATVAAKRLTGLIAYVPLAALIGLVFLVGVPVVLAADGIRALARRRRQRARGL